MKKGELEIKNLHNEVWKHIYGYEGMYQVSNKGRVKSLPRIVINKKGRYDFEQKRILKSVLMNFSIVRGYYRISLSNKGKKSNFFIHRLVATHFLNDSCEIINHIDGNRLNNLVDNLEWATQSENVRHGYLNISTSSIYRGVTWRKEMKKWRVIINIDGKKQTLGNFTDEVVAATVYINKCIELKRTIKYLLIPPTK